MALNNFTFATVRKIIRPRDIDVLGDDSVLALAETYLEIRMDIYCVPQSLSSVLKEGDLVVCDTGLVAVPNTDKTAPKKEIVKIIRGETRKELENMYAELAQKAKNQTKSIPIA